MKKWVKSLSSSQYQWLHFACSWGFTLLSVLSLWSDKMFGHDSQTLCWTAWGVFLALQIVSCSLLSRWRYGCNHCGKKFCGTFHRYDGETL